MIRPEWYKQKKPDFRKAFQEFDEAMMLAMAGYLSSLDEMARPSAISRSKAIRMAKSTVSHTYVYNLQYELRKSILRASEESYKNDLLMVKRMGKKSEKPKPRYSTGLNELTAFLTAYQVAWQTDFDNLMKDRKRVKEYAKTGVRVQVSPKTRFRAFKWASVLEDDVMSKEASHITNQLIRKLGIEYVLVSAHSDARVFRSNKYPIWHDHSYWQGQIYKIDGKDEYPNLYENTGYYIDRKTGEGKTSDDGLGLHGINCRHSHALWDKSLGNVREWMTDEFEYADDPYWDDKLQTQSRLEEKILELRRRRIFGENVDAEYNLITAEYRKYCKKYGLDERIVY